MAQNNTIYNIQKTLQLLKLMSRDEGASITEMTKEAVISRWTVRDMIDQMETFDSNGHNLCIEELDSVKDKRETRYHVPKETLWSITIPGMNLSDDEGMLLALLLEYGMKDPVLKDTTDKLKKKISIFSNAHSYEIINVQNIKKTPTKQTRSVILSILGAIEQGKCIEFSYKPVRRDQTTYQVMPLGVFKYSTGFYLSAQKLPGGEYRTFGIERIVGEPKIFDYSGNLPNKFDFESLFEDPFGPFEHIDEFEAVLKFDSLQGFFNLEKSWPQTVQVSENEDHTVTMKAKTHSVIGIKQFILSYGDGVEVLEPQWLRESIKEAHLKAAALYENKIPFEIYRNETPNAETVAAIKDADDESQLSPRFNNMKDLIEALHT